MRSRRFLIILLLSFSPLSPLYSRVERNGSLNRYGNIVFDHVFDGEVFGSLPGRKLENLNSSEFNSEDGRLLETSSGIISFYFRDGCPQQTICKFDRSGNLQFSRSFRQIINLQVRNHRYAAFFDGESLMVLDLESGDILSYPGSIIFALDADGHPVYYDPNSQCVHYKSRKIPLDSDPVEILFYQNQPVVFTSQSAFVLGGEQLSSFFSFSGKFFHAATDGESLYFVEKTINGRCDHFTLYSTQDLKCFTPICTAEFEQPSGLDTHEVIRSPLHYYEASFPSIVKNSYAQIQEWGDVYLHPGVDLFEEPYTEVYSVQDGVVRAILTTGDERYWRIAIEKLDGSQEGYLYAHLNQDSFVHTIGDTVAAGDFIGTLFPAWGFEPHCHFARITPEGEQWNGNWWTVDNPLVDISNMTDSIPPVFENALGSDLLAFRTRDGVYLDPLNLSGEIRIIARACDYAYSVAFESRINIWDVRFGLYAPLNPDSAVYEKYSFALDMPLDTYFSNQYETLALNTIYSRDATCFSTNNSTNKDFFYIITNSDGDSVITPEDSLQDFDTTELPNGPYLLKVFVRDAALNEVVGSMPVCIDNLVSVRQDTPGGVHPTAFAVSHVYPNPFNRSAVIYLSLPVESDVTLEIFDLGGRLTQCPLRNVHLTVGTHQAGINADNLPSGLYFYRLNSRHFVGSGKLVILK